MNHIDFNSLDDIVHNTVFSIPDYQRDYSWSRGEVETLLDDIGALYETNSKSGVSKVSKHFCGSIVTIAFDEEVSRNTRDILKSPRLKNFDKMNVIDGQQRLSTLSLLLIALRDYAKENGIELEEKIDQLIDTEKKDENSRLVPVINFSNINTQECYRSLLYGTSDKFTKKYLGAKHLNHNYQLCKQFIDEFCERENPEKAVNGLAEQVRYNLTFVGIYCEEDSDAYQIFESLNATGLSLTPAEQVKNIVLMKSKSRDQSLSQWENISSLVGEDCMVDFLSHFLFYKKSSRVSRKDTYSEFKNILRSDSVSSVLSELTNCAKVYAELKNPSANNPACMQLQDMRDFGQVQAYVPLLAAGVKFGVSTEDFASVVDSILVFVARHIVCGQSSNKLDAVFSSACEVMVDESKTAKDVIEFFKQQQQCNDVFEDYFRNLTFDYSAKPQKIAKTLLRRIEEKEWGAHMPISVDRKQLSVEHIIPKQPDIEVLRQWVGSSVIDAEGFDNVDFTNQVIKSIGNMAILYQPENSSAGNDNYEDKLNKYSADLKDSHGVSRGKPIDTFKLIGELVRDYPDKFDDKSVYQRAKDLAKKAVIAWS